MFRIEDTSENNIGTGAKKEKFQNGGFVGKDLYSQIKTDNTLQFVIHKKKTGDIEPNLTHSEKTLCIKLT